MGEGNFLPINIIWVRPRNIVDQWFMVKLIFIHQLRSIKKKKRPNLPLKAVKRGEGGKNVKKVG